jgi:hypothetical protein
VSTNKNGNGNQNGVEEEDSPARPLTGEAGDGGPPPPGLTEWGLKAALEAEAQEVLGRLWFGTELWAIRQLLPVARTVGVDKVRAAWRAFMISRKSTRKSKVRLAWFLDHVNEHLDAVLPETMGTRSVLRDHLQALVDENTITEPEAWEIQDGAEWVDPNDILAHIAGRRKTTPTTEVME